MESQQNQQIELTKKEIQEQQYELDKKKFWEKCKILMMLSDDSDLQIVYIIQIKSEYYLLASVENLIPYMHRIYEDYVQCKSTDLDKVIEELFDYISIDMVSPLFVTNASSYIYKKLKNKYGKFKNIIEEDHNKYFADEPNIKFNIKIPAPDPNKKYYHIYKDFFPNGF